MVPEDRSKLGHLNFRQGRWILRAPGRKEISRRRITLFRVPKVPALTVSGTRGLVEHPLLFLLFRRE